MLDRYLTGCVGAALVFAISARTAAAADVSGIETAIAGGRSSVDLVLSGHITARCSIGGGGAIDLGQLGVDKSVAAPLDVGCNVPFEMVFRSSAGGINHILKPQGEGPYIGTVPYSLSVSVPARAPLPTQLHASFTSAEMVAGGVLSSGDAIAAGGGEIQLRTQVIQGQDLLAGEYVDRISIVINPRV